MQSIFFTPIVLIAGVTAASFYSLYAFAQEGIKISSYVFVSAVSITAVGGLFRLITSGGHTSAGRKPTPAALVCMMCCTAGIAIGSYAELMLRKERQPPHTLAALPSVRTIIVELTGEPLPAGTDYYRIPVQAIACSAADTAEFSLSGRLHVLVPAALIRGTYAGGVTRIGERSGMKASSVLLNTAEPFSRFLHDAQPCRFYARGMRILVTGSFSKTGEVFYAKPVQPVFLGWSSSFSRMRALLRFAFMRMLYGWGNAGGLLLALLAADKAFLPQNCREAFRIARRAALRAQKAGAVFFAGGSLCLCVVCRIGAVSEQGARHGVYCGNRRSVRA